jgi:hypothetical protein
MVFIKTPTFTADVKAFLSDEDDAALQLHLVNQPDAGDVIAGTGGLRKVRWATAGCGKRGGTRVIYYPLGGSSPDADDPDLSQGDQR